MDSKERAYFLIWLDAKLAAQYALASALLFMALAVEMVITKPGPIFPLLFGVATGWLIFALRIYFPPKRRR